MQELFSTLCLDIMEIEEAPESEELLRLLLNYTWLHSFSIKDALPDFFEKFSWDPTELSAAPCWALFRRNRPGFIVYCTASHHCLGVYLCLPSREDRMTWTCTGNLQASPAKIEANIGQIRKFERTRYQSNQGWDIQRWCVLFTSIFAFKLPTCPKHWLLGCGTCRTLHTYLACIDTWIHEYMDTLIHRYFDALIHWYIDT